MNGSKDFAIPLSTRGACLLRPCIVTSGRLPEVASLKIVAVASS